MAASMRFFAALVVGAVCLTLAFVRTERGRPVGFERSAFDGGSKSTVILEPPPEVILMTSRITAKARVVARIVARELGLFEAAAHFDHLDSGPPEASPCPWSQLPGETREEKRCRQVILWVKAHGRDYMPQSEVAPFVAELEAVLAARLVEGGRIELPEVR